MSRPTQRTSVLVQALILVLVLLAPAAHANGPQSPPIFHPLPDGFSMYMTFMGTGLFDMTSPNPEVPNCFQQLCIGDYFFDVTLGWDAAEKQTFHEEALAYWYDRFGIDPQDPAWAGRVTTISFIADPRTNIRAYSMAGTRIPEAGWEVLDGGWMLIVTDPNGVDLGGEFAGVHVGPNSIFARGKYVVQARSKDGGFLADIVVDYQSRAPIEFIPGAPAVAGNCEIIRTTINGELTDWGSGHGQPSQLLIPTPTGETKVSYRNILTYGAGSGFGDPYP